MIVCTSVEQIVVEASTVKTILIIQGEGNDGVIISLPPEHVESLVKALRSTKREILED